MCKVRNRPIKNQNLAKKKKKSFQVDNEKFLLFKSRNYYVQISMWSTWYKVTNLSNVNSWAKDLSAILHWLPDIIKNVFVGSKSSYVLVPPVFQLYQLPVAVVAPYSNSAEIHSSHAIVHSFKLPMSHLSLHF